LYFNKEDERKGNGGNLKLYLNERSFDNESCYKSEHKEIEIEPKFNRLLIFFSETFHEVLPTYFERYSLTYWIYGSSEIHSKMIKKKLESKKSIFVSICSYRDAECQFTIKDLFEKSKFKNRIIVGVCHQYDADKDEYLFKEMPKDLKNQIKELHIPHQFSKGPGFARHLIQRYLFNGEDYYLQIDSHMRFEQDWDEILIEQLHQSEKISKKSIISTYPMGYKLPNELPETKQLILMVLPFIPKFFSVLLNSKKKMNNFQCQDLLGRF
jgi:[Skp1-protein]-hydroxyproline N-acetylglucosaminyltransferase